MQQQQPGMKQNIGSAIAIAQVFSLLMQVWLRVLGTAGVKHFGGFHMFAAMGLLLIYSTLIVPYSTETSLFVLLTGVMLAIHRVKHVWKRSRGYRVHSHYVGDSGLSFLGGDMFAKKFLEPAAVFFAAYIASTYGSPLAGFFGWCGVCLLISTWTAALADKALDQQLIDAQSDRELMTTKMRQL